MEIIKRFFVSVFSIFLALSLLASFADASSLQPEKIIFITLNYKDSALTVSNIASGNGFIPPFAESGLERQIGLEKAALKIYSEQNELLYESDFYVENKMFQDVIDKKTLELSGQILELNNVNFTVTAPYFKDMGKIEIYSIYNDIILAHVREKYDLTKTIVVPPFNAEKEKSDAKEKAGEEKTSDELEKAADEISGQKKSFFLELVDIINSVYYYIFR